MMCRDIRQRGVKRHTLLTRECEVQRNGTARQHGHLDEASHTKAVPVDRRRRRRGSG